MGLRDIFGKAEEVEEENKLEVVKTDLTTIEDLLSFFEQSIPTKREGSQEVFENYKRYLQSYTLTPKLVSKVSLALPKNKQKIPNSAIF